MNNENYEYLKEQVKMTGFGEGFQDELLKQMAEGKPEFQMEYKVKHGEKEMTYALNFKKSTTQDNYFFNSFDATLNKPGESVSTRFYTDQRVTAKEAFNLLEGRSVDKKYNHHEKLMEGDKEVYKAIKDSTYNVWLKLDFNDADNSGNFKMKTFGEKWGFDLEKKVTELPIKQLQDADDKNDLLNSLKKGNVQSVTFEQNGNSETRYIEANPRARTINVYDAQMQPILDTKQAKNIAPEKAETTGEKQSQKNKVESSEEEPKEGQKKRRNRKQGV